ncbi:MAG: hypothetical protein AAB582_02255 [Patescibacteria group bacterium]
MKNLDDLLKTKAAQAETEKKLKAQEEERTARENVKGSISSLETSKKQLSVVKESLSMEKEGRGKATRRKQSAESKIDSKVGDLEKYGISKDELLTNPEYSELEEVEEVKGANEEAEIFSSPSVENDALKAKLESLGVEVPENASESDIESLVSERMNSIDKELVLKRIEIPGEKEKIVDEILAEKNLLTDSSLNSFNTVRNVPAGYNNGLVGSSAKEAYQHFDSKLSRIPLVQEYPELKQAVMEKIARQIVLKEEKAKTEKVVAERARHEEGVQKYGWSRQNGPQQTDYERYEMYQSNNAYYEKQAEEAGVSLEELMEKDERVRSGVISNRSNIQSYESKVFRPAKQLGEYVAAKAELETAPRPSYGEDSRTLGEAVERLTTGVSKLVKFPNNLQVQFDDDYSGSSYSRGEVSFLIPSELERREGLYENMRTAKTEVETLENEYRALGNKPTGMFSGGAQKKWDADTTALRSKIEAKAKEVERLQREAGSIDVRVSLGALGEDVLDTLRKNPDTTIGDIGALLRDRATEIQQKVAKSKELETSYSSKQDRVKKLEESRLEVSAY